MEVGHSSKPFQDRATPLAQQALERASVLPCHLEPTPTAASLQSTKRPLTRSKVASVTAVYTGIRAKRGPRPVYRSTGGEELAYSQLRRHRTSTGASEERGDTPLVEELPSGARAVDVSWTCPPLTSRRWHFGGLGASSPRRAAPLPPSPTNGGDDTSGQAAMPSFVHVRQCAAVQDLQSRLDYVCRRDERRRYGARDGAAEQVRRVRLSEHELHRRVDLPSGT